MTAVVATVSDAIWVDGFFATIIGGNDSSLEEASSPDEYEYESEPKLELEYELESESESSCPSAYMSCQTCWDT